MVERELTEKNENSKEDAQDEIPEISAETREKIRKLKLFSCF